MIDSKYTLTPEDKQETSCPLCGGKRYILSVSFADSGNRTYQTSAYAPCPECVTVPRQYPRRNNKKPRQGFDNSSAGYLYVVRAHGTEWCKIGITRDPQSRLVSLRTGAPTEIDVEVMMESPRYGKLERELHRRFADKRGNGEWFALDADDVEYIKSLAVQS